MTQNEKLPYSTADGSSTLYSSQYKAHYHSLHGAIAEAMHIFIDAGLSSVNANEITMLEVGLGTALNCALTAQWALANEATVNYHALELHPLTSEELGLLNYSNSLDEKTAVLWNQICKAPWDEKVQINKNFSLLKQKTDFTQWQPNHKYNLVYFDAFAPDDQPEMWTDEQFCKVFSSMEPQGVLVTYSVKGSVKRTLTSVGFTIERLTGPPGKKHMLRATKP